MTVPAQAAHRPELVMIPGWGMHSQSWGDFADRLSSRFRLRLVDLPGHGRSGHAGSWDLDAAVDRAFEASGRAHWLGWSLGGLVALRAALRAPERVDRLVLVASTPRFVATRGWADAQRPDRFRRFEEDLSVDAQCALDRFLGVLFHGTPDAEGWEARFRVLHGRLPAPGERSLASAARVLAEADLRGELARIEAPALWIAGSEDPLVPFAACRRAAALMPRARAEVLEGAGHVPFLTHEAQTHGLVEAFLDSEATA